MSDNNHGHRLSEEWKLLWDGLMGHDENLSDNSELLDPPKALTKEKIKLIKKELSQNRQDLNRQLEQIQKQIEELTHKIEALNVVGGDAESVVLDIGRLTEQGEKISADLDKINKKISWVRKGEKLLKTQSEPST